MSTRGQFFRGRAAGWVRLSPDARALGEHLTAGLRDRHPAHDVLLHGDLVPTNVLLTAHGPRLIDPVGRRGLAAWDLAQLAAAAEGRGRRRLLAGLLEGYGAAPPLLREMTAWMVLFYLDKNLASPESPFTPRLRPLADALVELGDATAFVERCLV